MSAARPLGPVTADELLARFITDKDWIRADQTLRQDAFIPPKDLQLSVTRHLNLPEEQLWSIGAMVVAELAEKKAAALHGRADLSVERVLRRHLRAVAAPLPKNPNHAHVTGWPADKSARKNIAQELAAEAGKLVPAPKAPA